MPSLEKETRDKTTFNFQRLGQRLGNRGFSSTSRSV
jgi:hypothetical protein